MIAIPLLVIHYFDAISKPMKTLILTFLLVLTSAQAAQLTINLPCSDEILRFSAETRADQSVGDLSVKIFKAHQIPFQGTAMGMNSILETPTGSEALDIVSDSEMFAYGWCYSINGYEPELFPNEIQVSDNDHIVWWFGYAHYKEGQWISQCEPSSTRRLSTYCQENL